MARSGCGDRSRPSRNGQRSRRWPDNTRLPRRGESAQRGCQYAVRRAGRKLSRVDRRVPRQRFPRRDPSERPARGRSWRDEPNSPCSWEPTARRARGSLNARRAVTFLSRLHPPTGGRTTIVRVVEPVGLQSAGLLPGGIRGTLRREVAALNAERIAKAERDVEKDASQLRRAAWRVRTSVRSGEPLTELLATVAETKAHVLVVGARGAR